VTPGWSPAFCPPDTKHEEAYGRYVRLLALKGEQFVEVLFGLVFDLPGCS
jgi:hypothetical protein